METEKEIRKTNEIVKELLEKDIYTRKSDTYLILEVLRELGIKVYIPYKDLKDLPSFETITRTRRDLQKKFPDLVDKETQRKRDKREDDFKDFYSSERGNK